MIIPYGPPHLKTNFTYGGIDKSLIVGDSSSSPQKFNYEFYFLIKIIFMHTYLYLGCYDQGIQMSIQYPTYQTIDNAKQRHDIGYVDLTQSINNTYIPIIE